MGKQIPFLVAVSLVLFGCSGAVHPPSCGISPEGSAESITARFSHDASSRAADLIVDLPDSAAPCEERVILQNQGFLECSFVPESELPSRLVLVGPEGSVPLTTYGQSQLGPHSVFSAASVRLPPSLSYVWNIDLRRVFQITRAGLYRLQVGQSVRYTADDGDAGELIGIDGLPIRVR